MDLQLIEFLEAFGLEEMPDEVTSEQNIIDASQVVHEITFFIPELGIFL